MRLCWFSASCWNRLAPDHRIELQRLEPQRQEEDGHQRLDSEPAKRLRAEPVD